MEEKKKMLLEWPSVNQAAGYANVVNESGIF